MCDNTLDSISFYSEVSFSPVLSANVAFQRHSEIRSNIWFSFNSTQQLCMGQGEISMCFLCRLYAQCMSVCKHRTCIYGRKLDSSSFLSACICGHYFVCACVCVCASVFTPFWAISSLPSSVQLTLIWPNTHTQITIYK